MGSSFSEVMQTVGLAAAVVLPLWNIPLILRIEHRKSSADLSLWWTLGVFVCFVLMLPSAVASSDRVFKTFSLMNIVLFGAVVVQVLRYRKGGNG